MIDLFLSLIPIVVLVVAIGLFIWACYLNARAEQNNVEAIACLRATVDLIKTYDRAVELYDSGDPVVGRSLLSMQRHITRTVIRRHCGDFKDLS